MTHAAYLLVIAGAVFAALYNIFTKKTLTPSAEWSWKGREALLTTLHMATASLILFVVCMITGGPQIKSGFWFPVITTGLLNIGIQYFNMMARSKEDVSLVVPISASTPAIVIVTSMMILGEYPSRLGWIGIYCLVIGTYVLNMQGYVSKVKEQTGKSTIKDWLAPFFMLGRSVGVRYAFLSVLLASFSLNYDGLSQRRANVSFALGIVCGIVAVFNFILARAKGETKGLILAHTVQLKGIWLLGLVYATSNWITGWAYRAAIVPYVGTLKRLQIPLTIILAFLILGEKTNFKQRLLGGIIMAIGATLIAIA